MHLCRRFGSALLFLFRSIFSSFASGLKMCFNLSGFFRVLLYYTNKINFGWNYFFKSKSVPAVSKIRPMNDFFVSFSLRIIPEKAIVIKILSLSIGTTILAGPS